MNANIKQFVLKVVVLYSKLLFSFQSYTIDAELMKFHKEV